MRVLVTGHKGFIGRNVFLDWQETLGYVNVDGIDRPDDIADFKGGDYDLVIHLAAYADIRESLKNPQLYYENNVVKTKKLFDWCRETNTRLLYASSSAVEEDYWEIHAMTKWINEITPPNSVGMRFTTVYGPDSRPNMMYQWLGTDATYVTNHKRDWIHVKDVCPLLLFWHLHITGPVTIGTGKSTSAKNLLCPWVWNTFPLEDTPGERMDNQRCDSFKSIGWFPTIDVQDQTNS